MFIRKNKNRSGSTSVQIVSKAKGRYKVIHTEGSGKTEEEITFLYNRARQRIFQMQGSMELFAHQEDEHLVDFISSLSNDQVQVIGPELIFGRIFDHIGFDVVEGGLFRHLIITRLYQPGSKLKTIDYLARFLGVYKQVDEIYRFLDKLANRLKIQVEQVAFAHTHRVLGGQVNIVFYDMTTLHFEASDEDDLRRMGFSKVGKHQNPQIFLGLLVGLNGFPIGYEIFEGNIFEGHTLIPVLKQFAARFGLQKPIVVADSGLLTKDNIKTLQSEGYQYIIGARIRNEPEKIKQKILANPWSDNTFLTMNKSENTRLVVAYSSSRAKKDAHNRKRGLQRLEKSLKKGRLTKANINNRGYNKYLQLTGDVLVEINYDKYFADQAWDGIKGYHTNTKLRPQEIIDNYKHLWQIEKAFRISKTDLQIRPIFHRLRHRIDGHICIAFAAYAIYKELERILYKEKSTMSVKRAAELTHNMYQLNITLPGSKHQKSILLKMSEEQEALYKIILRNY